MLKRVVNFTFFRTPSLSEILQFYIIVLSEQKSSTSTTAMSTQEPFLWVNHVTSILNSYFQTNNATIHYLEILSHFSARLVDLRESRQLARATSLIKSRAENKIFFPTILNRRPKQSHSKTEWCQNSSGMCQNVNSHNVIIRSLNLQILPLKSLKLYRQCLQQKSDYKIRTWTEYTLIRFHHSPHFCSE